MKFDQESVLECTEITHPLQIPLCRQADDQIGILKLHGTGFINTNTPGKNKENHYVIVLITYLCSIE